MSTPGTMQTGFLGQFGGDDIAAAIVGILDPRISTAPAWSAPSQAAATSAVICWRASKVFRVGKFCFIPVGYTGDAFQYLR